MKDRFASWLRTQAGPRKEAAGVDTWIAVGVLAVGIVAAGCWIPPTRVSFEGDARLWLLCFAPAFLFSIVGAWLEKKGRLSLHSFGVAVLISACLLQFFLAVLVVSSALPGAWFLAALYLLSVTYHSYLLKVSYRFPYGAAVTTLATLAAMPLAAHEESRLVLGIAFGLALPLGLVLGTFGLRGYSAEIQQTAMRDAVHAQALREAARERELVLEQLLELLRTNHDCRNTLSTVFVNAQLLRERSQKEQIDEQDVAEMYRMVDVLTRGLGRLKELLEKGRELRCESVKVEPVILEDVLPEVIEEVKSCYPGIRLECAGPPDGGPSWISMAGGRLTLHRVLHNLVLNACEGDGMRRASAVQVRWSVPEDEEGVIIECLDDGPGFSSEQLKTSPPVPFSSTKDSGTGLGLYTAWQLLQASGGDLECTNAERGGAIVTVRIGMRESRPNSERGAAA